MNPEILEMAQEIVRLRAIVWLLLNQYGETPLDEKMVVILSMFPVEFQVEHVIEDDGLHNLYAKAIPHNVLQQSLVDSLYESMEMHGSGEFEDVPDVFKEDEFYDPSYDDPDNPGNYGDERLPW